MLRKLSNLKYNNVTLLSEYEQIGDAYGNTLSSIPIDWGLIIPKLEWTRHLFQQLNDSHVGDALAQHVTLPGQTLDPPTKIKSHSKELKSHVSDLSSLFTERHASWPILTDGSADFNDILALTEKLRNRIAEVPDLIQLRRIYKDSTLVNLMPFIEACLQKHVSGDNLTLAFKVSILRLWIDWIISHDTTLGRHHRDSHDHQVNNFKKVDRRLWENGPSRVIVKAKSHLPNNYSPVPGGETSVIFRERQKKRKLLPIRKLFAKIPRLLPDLKPCLLMSPLSVSQFLTPDVGQFDLLIFDEASQIRAEDAIGCIYRCKQIIVCGDEKQLPPTLFFEQGILDDLDVDEADEYYDEFESIIKQCLAVGIKSRWLRWHYRSRHESLIVFSNKQFYWERPLVTFPASRETAPELGVELIFVPDGVYDRGHTRTNESEARKVVLKVEELVKLYPDKSLGIVTFSVAQKEMVEDLLEESMKINSTLAEIAGNDRLTGLFVKNLESVQGDERDIIIFSIGYGRDKQGRMAGHFGPLNRLGGERRLNVAITRAREKVIVVSSIKSDDIKISPKTPLGVQSLHKYLDFAENGIVALEYDNMAGGDFESPLEVDVGQVIISLGYEITPQVGCSGYRIDIGVRHPEKPGRFILGVECDGATYHSSMTARDRDRLRQEILESLGWQIYRIWSPSWVTQRKEEIRKLEAALVSAQEKYDNHPDPKHLRVETSSPTLNVTTNITNGQLEDIDEVLNHNSLPDWTETYKLASLPIPQNKAQDFYHPSAAKYLQTCIIDIARTEGPVHIEIVAQRIAENWNHERVSAKMMKAIIRAAKTADTHGYILLTTARFLLPRKRRELKKIRVPDPIDSRTFREIEHITRDELGLALKFTVAEAYSISENDRSCPEVCGNCLT